MQERVQVVIVWLHCLMHLTKGTDLKPFLLDAESRFRQLGWASVRAGEKSVVRVFLL